MSDEIREVLAEAVRSEEARRAAAAAAAAAARERRIQEQRRRQDEESRRKRLQELQRLRGEQAIISEFQEFQGSQREAIMQEGLEFFRKYVALYGLRLKAVENGTFDKFEELVSRGFGYPWDRLAYTQEELKNLPTYLKNRQDMNLLLSLGLWPFKRAQANVLSPPTPNLFSVKT